MFINSCINCIYDQVSWIRIRDLTVLSSGRITIATDVRISVLPGTGRANNRVERTAKNAENIIETPMRMNNTIYDHRKELMIKSIIPLKEFKNSFKEEDSSTSPMETLKPIRLKRSIHGDDRYYYERNDRYDKSNRQGGGNVNAEVNEYNESESSWERFYGGRYLKSKRPKAPHHDEDFNINNNYVDSKYINHRVYNGGQMHNYEQKYLPTSTTMKNTGKTANMGRNGFIVSSWDKYGDKSSDHRMLDSGNKQEYREGKHAKQIDNFGDVYSGTSYNYGDKNPKSKVEFNSDSFSVLLKNRKSRTKPFSDKEVYSKMRRNASDSHFSQIQVTALSKLDNKGGYFHNTRQSSRSISKNIEKKESENDELETNGSASIIASNYLEGVWEPEDFTLQIKYTEAGDSGTYVCQVNTEPKTAQKIQLTVIGKEIYPS